MIFFKLCYRFRMEGHRRIPLTGPVLFVSNHQSYLDPIITGLGIYKRPFFALARKTLWKHKLVARLIDSLSAFPVDQGGSDLKAMRLCLDILKADHALVVYPEGSRTPNGELQDFAPGTALMIKRAKPTVIPVGLDGSFDVFPRGAKRPKLFGRIACVYGEPIPGEELAGMKPDAMLGRLRTEVQTLVDRAGELRG